MSTALTVTEENYSFWRTAALISAALAIISFIIFLSIENPFWESIVRLGAFIFFALAVLSYLQIMNGPIKVTLTLDEKVLLITYRKNDKIIHEEELEKETIKSVFPTAEGINILLSNMKPDIKTFKISFTDTDHPLYLFEFSGRPLLFGEDDQHKIVSYLDVILDDH